MTNTTQKFFVCEHCGNLVGMIVDSGVPMICCGEEMNELKPNTTEAATEKHLPVIKTQGNMVTVTVSTVLHPMIPEHFIEWIYLQTKSGGQRKALTPNSAPEINFMLTEDDEVVAAFAYCNLHGLWKTKA